MTFSLVLTGLFALSTQAAPSGWAATFPPDALPAPLSARSLVVVAVDDASKEPALALEAALRRATKAPRVERWSRPAANLATLGDRELVEASRSTGTERVAIVRAYPPSVGSEPVAVVAVYARAGAVVATFAAHRGTPIGAPAGSAPVAEVEGMDAVATYRPEREARLKESYLGLEEGALFQSGTKVGEFNEPYQGEAKRKLEWPEFYEVVGRKDLASKQRGFNAARTVVGFTSLDPRLGGRGLSRHYLFSISRMYSIFLNPLSLRSPPSLPPSLG